MKLIGNLKKQVEETKNKKEAKEVIEKAGMELTDEELDQVAGGVPLFVSGGSTYKVKYDCSCKNPEPGGRNAAFPDIVYCKNCGGEI